MPGEHGLVVYWRADLAALTATAGELRPCTSSLIGAYAIQEEAFSHDPAVMLYPPLRTLIYIDASDRTRFAIDQPNTVFSSLSDPVIAAAGLGLDRQLTDLLTVPGVHAGPVLGAETAPAHRSGQQPQSVPCAHASST